MSAWRAADGQVRWFWVVGSFALLVLVVMSGVALGLAQHDLFNTEHISGPIVFITLPQLIGSSVATLVTWLAFKRPIGLADPHALRNLGVGLLLGGVALLFAVLPPYFVGAQGLQFEGAPVLELVVCFAALAPAGIGEELMLRGLAFEVVRQRFGDRTAVLASGLVFGVLHLTNPHASWVAAAIIALVGVWFAQLRVLSGSLWLPIGLHLGWNYFEGVIFGQPVSGLQPGAVVLRGLWHPDANFWSGGPFGPEAAGWTVLVLLAGVGFTEVARRRSLT